MLAFSLSSVSAIDEVKWHDGTLARFCVLGLYDLKTVYGKSSVETQLLDSIGQTNRVLLNMLTDYNARLLASDIKTYFETNHDAIEVLIFKGKKIITVKRGLACNPSFNRIFRRVYEK